MGISHNSIVSPGGNAHQKSCLHNSVCSSRKWWLDNATTFYWFRAQDQHHWLQEHFDWTTDNLIAKCYDSKHVMLEQDSVMVNLVKLFKRPWRLNFQVLCQKKCGYSPDLNPCAYWQWDIIEVKSSPLLHRTLLLLPSALLIDDFIPSCWMKQEPITTFRKCGLGSKQVIVASGSHSEKRYKKQTTAYNTNFWATCNLFFYW